MFCTQNQLITENAPIYLYEAVIQLKLMVLIPLTAINIKVVGSKVQVFYPYNCTVQTIIYNYDAQL